MKTSIDKVYEDLKHISEKSFERRLFKVFKISLSDVLQPKFNALFKTGVLVCAVCHHITQERIIIY